MQHSIIFLIGFLSFGVFGQTDLTFSANKRLVQPAILKENNTYDAKDLVEISFQNPSGIDSKGTKKYQWSINGATEDGKGWVLKPNTSTTGEKLQIYFTKVGNYTVSLVMTVTVKTKVGDETEEEETEYSGETEEFISVRSVFPELAALYAQKPIPDYVKLVEKASEYSVKPKYASDPTPHLFLAKGYLGLVKTTNTDPRFESAFEECISSFNTARELDKNGVIFDDEHQRFLIELETYIFDENIKENVSADPKSDADGFDILTEYVEYYNQVSFAPITSTLLQAVIKYTKKDVKGANLIWNTEIPKLKKYESLNIETVYGVKFKNEIGTELVISKVDLIMLKIGVMKSAMIMKTRDGNSTKACELIKIVTPWFENDREFNLFLDKEFNSCGE